MSLEKANSIDFSEFLVSEPYPEVTKGFLQDELVFEIKRGFAGKESELTSVTQYIYQYFLLFKDNLTDNIGKNLQIISGHETIHFEILAKKLSYAGVDPKLCRFVDKNPNICDYWSGQNINYVKELTNMMISNIKLEEGAIEAYNWMLSVTTDDNLKELVTRILKDEHSHMEYFKAVLEALN